MVLEAAQCRNLVIATPRGGITELIKNGENGIILKEDASDLVEKITTVLDNPDNISKMANRANKDINARYTWEETGKIIRKELKKYEKN